MSQVGMGALRRVLLFLGAFGLAGCLQPVDGSDGGLPPQRPCFGCPSGSRCNTRGDCVQGCTIPAACDGRECGGDGCLGLCGACAEGETCHAFRCAKGCGFSYRLEQDGQVWELSSHTAQFAVCAHEAQESHLGNHHGQRLMNGQPQGVISVLLSWMDAPPKANAALVLSPQVVTPTVAVQVEGVSSELDGKYDSRTTGSQVRLRVGELDHRYGGAFEVTFEEGSTLAASSGKRLRLAGSTFGRFE